MLVSRFSSSMPSASPRSCIAKTHKAPKPWSHLEHGRLDPNWFRSDAVGHVRCWMLPNRIDLIDSREDFLRSIDPRIITFFKPATGALSFVVVAGRLPKITLDKAEARNWHQRASPTPACVVTPKLQMKKAEWMSCMRICIFGFTVADDSWHLCAPDHSLDYILYIYVVPFVPVGCSMAGHQQLSLQQATRLGQWRAGPGDGE